MAEDILGGDSQLSPMSTEQIFYKVCDIMKNESLVQMDVEIRMATLMTDQLGLDSLDYIELSLEIDREFGVQIPDDDFYTLNTQTVGTLCNIIERELAKKASK